MLACDAAFFADQYAFACAGQIKRSEDADNAAANYDNIDGIWQGALIGYWRINGDTSCGFWVQNLAVWPAAMSPLMMWLTIACATVSHDVSVD